MRQLGGAFGVAILAAVFAAAGSYGSPAAFSDGFTAAIAVTAVLGLAGVLAALALPGLPPGSGHRRGTGAGAAPGQGLAFKTADSDRLFGNEKEKETP